MGIPVSDTTKICKILVVVLSNFMSCCMMTIRQLAQLVCMRTAFSNAP